MAPRSPVVLLGQGITAPREGLRAPASVAPFRRLREPHQGCSVRRGRAGRIARTPRTRRCGGPCPRRPARPARRRSRSAPWGDAVPVVQVDMIGARVTRRAIEGAAHVFRATVEVERLTTDSRRPVGALPRSLSSAKGPQTEARRPAVREGAGERSGLVGPSDHRTGRRHPLQVEAEGSVRPRPSAAASDAHAWADAPGRRRSGGVGPLDAAGVGCRQSVPAVTRSQRAYSSISSWKRPRTMSRPAVATAR